MDRGRLQRSITRRQQQVGSRKWQLKVAWYPIAVRALGIDYGERRIGLALSDPTGLLASPWKKIDNDANVGAAAQRLALEIDALVSETDGLGAIVIGLPRRLSGEDNAQTGRVRTLARLLGDKIAIPITFQDERLTSREADERLAARERDWRKRKQRLDAMAAALILQDYLDHQPRHASAGGESAEPTASAERDGEGQRGPAERIKER
jgi:putative Holliday junction resolvase